MLQITFVLQFWLKLFFAITLKIYSTTFFDREMEKTVNF